MKRFLTYSLIFSLLIAVTLAAGEMVCRHYPNPYAYKDKYLKLHANEIETLILGSSVAYYGINPEYLTDSTFNLANVSQNFEYDYRLLKKYIADMDALKRIILTVNYTSFTDRPLEETGEWIYSQGYCLYMDINRNPRLSRYGFEIANLNGYAGKLRNLIAGKNSIICDSLGHGTAMPASQRSPHWRDEVVRTVERHSATDFSQVNYNRAYLDSLLDLATSRQIAVVIVSTPLTRAYRDAMPQQQCRLSHHLIDSITTCRQLQWIDLSADESFTDDVFYDGDHLSSDIGAEQLSLKLRALLPPL